MIDKEKKELIEKMMLSKHFTQKEIADISGVSLRTIKDIAKGLQSKKKEPSATKTNDSRNSAADNSSTTKKQPSSKKKKHAFATVIYEESAPADWKQILNDMHMEILVSPLHDKDVNPDDGELKKPHRHVLLMFPSPRSEKQAKEIFDRIGGVGIEAVQTMRGYARYLCHLDNPEKYQYDKSDIIAFGGVDYYAITTLPTDTDDMLREIFAYIRQNNIMSFARLIDIAAVNNPDWFRLATTQRTYVIDKYIKSITWEVANK